MGHVENYILIERFLEEFNLYKYEFSSEGQTQGIHKNKHLARTDVLLKTAEQVLASLNRPVNGLHLNGAADPHYLAKKKQQDAQLFQIIRELLSREMAAPPGRSAEADTGTVQNEAFFKTLITCSDAVIVVMNENLQPVYSNRAAQELFGDLLDKWNGCVGADYIFPGDIDAVKNSIDQAKRNPGETVPFRQRVKFKGRYYIYLEGTLTNLLHDPNVKGIVYNVRDVSDEVVAKLTLEESDAGFRELFDLAPAALFVLDVKTKTFLKFNANALKLTGYIPEDLWIMGPLDISPEFQPGGISSQELAGEVLAETMRGGRPVMEWLIRDASGNEKLCEMRLVMLSDKQGARILASFVDISERKKAEEELLRTLKEIKDYKFALDEASIVAVTDQEGKIKYVNDRFCEISGYSREELIGNDHRLLNSGYHSKTFMKDLWETIERGEVWKGEVKNKAKDGSAFWVDTTIVPFLDENRKPVQYVAIRSDITAGKKLDETLRASERQIRNFAKHLHKVQEEERAHIAREIHDQLGQEFVGIKIGLSEIVKNKAVPQNTVNDVKEMIGTVDNAIQSLRKIATELRPGILDSMGLLSSIEWLGKEFERKTGIRCDMQLTATDQVVDKNISICFFRICQEALTNISKHAACDHVIISLSQTTNQLTMRITDNGIGMPDEKIKNPFSMGMLGMRERASNIGSELYVSSEKGRGTSIQLTASLK
jgi:PAS domain S-box-containing protein